MTYVPGVRISFRKRNPRSRMSEIGQRRPTACFPGTGAKPIIRLARRHRWKNAEGTKRGLGRKEFPRGESFRLSPRKRAIVEGDKMVKGANRVECIVRIFERNLPPFQRLSLICLFVPNETKTNFVTFSFNSGKKEKVNVLTKLICVLIC